MDVNDGTFTDKLLRCQECGTEFVFTVTEQRDIAASGQPVVDPRLCPTCRKLVARSGKLHGTVKWFSRQRGYGFITKADGEDIFFHRTAIEGRNALDKGQEVEFEIEETDKGPQAINVRPLSAE